MVQLILSYNAREQTIFTNNTLQKSCFAKVFRDALVSGGIASNRRVGASRYLYLEMSEKSCVVITQPITVLTRTPSGCQNTLK